MDTWIHLLEPMEGIIKVTPGITNTVSGGEDGNCLLGPMEGLPLVLL